MRFNQIVNSGNSEDIIHNFGNFNPSLETAQKNDLVLISSDVKKNYSHYGLVRNVLDKTTAVIKSGKGIQLLPL